MEDGGCQELVCATSEGFDSSRVDSEGKGSAVGEFPRCSLLLLWSTAAALVTQVKVL